METPSRRMQSRKSASASRNSLMKIYFRKNHPKYSISRDISAMRNIRPSGISLSSLKVDLSKRVISPSNELNVAWSCLPGVSMPSKWGSSFIPRSDGLYFYGGGRRSMYQLDYLSKELTEMPAPSKRVGHSLVQYRDQIITYGGVVKKNNMKTLSKKVHMFNIQLQTWSLSKGFGQLPEPRAFHAATQIGRHFVMFGGITKSFLANDLALLDITTMSWVCPELNGPPRLSHASLTAVVHPYVKNNIKASMLTLAETKCYYAFQNSGLYLFGGIDVKKQPRNNVYRLTGSKGALTWESIKTYGTPPCPRYSHSAAATGELLVIFGGKNNHSLFYDLHILNVVNWKWVRVQEKGDSPNARYAHCMQDYGSKILVFGGLNSYGYLDSHVYVLEANLQLIEKVQRNILQRIDMFDNGNETFQ